MLVMRTFLEDVWKKRNHQVRQRSPSEAGSGPGGSSSDVLAGDDGPRSAPWHTAARDKAGFRFWLFHLIMVAVLIFVLLDFKVCFFNSKSRESLSLTSFPQFPYACSFLPFLSTGRALVGA